MKPKVTFKGLSNVGLVRQNNEDYWCFCQESNLFILADGMGGHNCGEIASKAAVDKLQILFQNQMAIGKKDIVSVKRALYLSISQMNHEVFNLSRTSSSLKGMGTTLCALHIHSEGVVYGHVGDSRIYRLRGKDFTCLTQDHSLLRELIDLGRLSEQQADEFTYKNVLTKAIGTEQNIDPTVKIDSVVSGDLLLICSDGLTDMLSDSEIANILSVEKSCEAADILINMALKNGGRDNITAIVILVQDEDEKNNLF